MNEITVDEIDKEVLQEAAVDQVFRCPRCMGGKTTRSRHCYVDRHGDFIDTCTRQGCECKCRSHFQCKKCGFLRPYKGEHVCAEYIPPKPSKRKLTEEEVEDNEEADKLYEQWLERKNNG